MRRLHLVRQLEHQHLAGGHGGVAAHHDGAADDVEQRLGGLVLDRGAAGEDGAQEPPRTVDPGEAGGGEDGAPVGAGRGHPGAQLGAECTAGLVGGAALREDRLGDLTADVVPDAHRLRRREGLDLDGGVTDDRSGADDLVGRLVDLEAQLHAGDAHDAQGAQVKPAVVVLDLGGVERSGDAGRVHGRLARRRVGLRPRRPGAGMASRPVGRVDAVDGVDHLDLIDRVGRVGVLVASENAHW